MLSIARVGDQEESGNGQSMHRDTNYHRDPQILLHEAGAHGLAGCIDEEARGVEREESLASACTLDRGSEDEHCVPTSAWAGRRYRLAAGRDSAMRALVRLSRTLPPPPKRQKKDWAQTSLVLKV